jgi:hypothetical protein
MSKWLWMFLVVMTWVLADWDHVATVIAVCLIAVSTFPEINSKGARK